MILSSKKRRKKNGNNGQGESKIFVLDSSTMLHDPNCFEKFHKNNRLLIPIYALQELDKIKRYKDSLGKSARDAIRNYEDFRIKYPQLIMKDTGVIDFKDYEHLDRTNDNKIILSAKRVQKENPDKKVYIISKDINLRNIAAGMDLAADDYKNDKILDEIDELYSGTTTIPLSPDGIKLIQSELYKNHSISAQQLADFVDAKLLLANQCCIFASTTNDQYALALYKKAKGIFELVLRPQDHKRNQDKKNSIIPENIEQCFAFALLVDKGIHCVTNVGTAGTGKTLMALLAAWQQLQNNNKDYGNYEKIAIYRPNIEIGTPLGFLPGDINDKFAPWMEPIFDNLERITKGLQDKNHKNGKTIPSNMAKELMDFQQLSIGPINQIRGRSIHDTFVIVDECQNLTPHIVKTIITRASEGTKIILNGDLYQIDNPFLDATSNGLSYAVEKFKNQELFGHITLTQTRRSPLAELAAKLLR